MVRTLFRPVPLLLIAAPLVVLATILLWKGPAPAQTTDASDPASHNSTPGAANRSSAAIRVEVVTPKVGGLTRVTVQPGSVHSFETAHLYAKVSGYLKSQSVDIGDHVTKAQLLAVIHAPELEKELARTRAEVERAKGGVKQAEAGVVTAEAQVEAARAAEVEAQAAIKRDAAYLAFREKQYGRMRDLFNLKSIDERLVDEKEDQFLAAQSDLEKSHAIVATAKAKIAAAEAQLQEAKANVAGALARVTVAEAEMQKAAVFVQYTQITAPFDGVITGRNFFAGDFIKSADDGAIRQLLTVSRIDKMRVVVQVPDRDVPYTDPGDPAVVEIDALPGSRFTGVVARHADSEDHETRTMRTEIDLANDDHRLRDGMYGQVTITLDTTDTGLTLPSACLTGQTRDGKAAVYVVEGDNARLTPVGIGKDNGIYVAVLGGLKPEQQVVFRYNGALSDGKMVQVVRTRTVEDAVKQVNR